MSHRPLVAILCPKEFKFTDHAASVETPLLADVVSSGRTLRQHGLVVIGEAIAESQATLIEREPRPDREQTVEVARMKRVFTERLRGVVLARQYLMMEYDCPKTVKDSAIKITRNARQFDEGCVTDGLDNRRTDFRTGHENGPFSFWRLLS